MRAPDGPNACVHLMGLMRGMLAAVTAHTRADQPLHIPEALRHHVRRTQHTAIRHALCTGHVQDKQQQCCHGWAQVLA